MVVAVAVAVADKTDNIVAPALADKEDNSSMTEDKAEDSRDIEDKTEPEKNNDDRVDACSCYNRHREYKQFRHFRMPKKHSKMLLRYNKTTQNKPSSCHFHPPTKKSTHFA